MKKAFLVIPLLCLSFFVLSCSQDVPLTPPSFYPPTEEPSSSFLNHYKRSDFNKSNLKEILKNETSEEIKNRSFTTNEVITASTDNKGRIVVTSYAPVTVKDVSIYSGKERIAFIDEVYGFSEAVIELKKEVEGLNNNTKLIVVSDDPFMKKIQKITFPMKVSFLQDNSGPWKAIDNKRSREAAILAITMSYMFNHEAYLPHLLSWNDGGYIGKDVTYVLIPGVISFTWLPSNPFRDDNGSLMDGKTVLNRALGVRNLNLTLIKESEPAGGIGGGSVLGIRDYLYDNFMRYTTLPSNGQKEQELKCYVVNVIFHEFAHCMGFYHNTDPYPGTMTYGGGWTTANYVFLNQLISNNDLPIPLDGTWESNIGFPKDL